MAFSLKGLFLTLRIDDTYHAECLYARCHYAGDTMANILKTLLLMTVPILH